MGVGNPSALREKSGVRGDGWRVWWRMQWMIVVIVGIGGVREGVAWQSVHVPWTEKHWCESVFEPEWPFSYAKESGDAIEWKPRSGRDIQALGHVCTTKGARTKCHRCEDIACGDDLTQTCAFQIQGMDWEELAKNVPGVTDTPFAVGSSVSHRFDFGNAERVCHFVSGGGCLGGDGGVSGTDGLSIGVSGEDYSSCVVRCFGANQPSPPTPYAEGWEYSSSVGNPQGRVTTWAGGGNAGPPVSNGTEDSLLRTKRDTPPSGFRDGIGGAARFDLPQGVAVDALGNVFVADTGNHAIRRLDPSTMEVVTVAGPSGMPGWTDGNGAKAEFSSPMGIDLFYDCEFADAAFEGSDCPLVLVVADAGNHRVRELRGPGLLEGSASSASSIFAAQKRVRVSTLAGGGESLPPGSAPQGFADGWGRDSRFNTLRDVAVDWEDAGTVYVADTLNHVIRRVERIPTSIPSTTTPSPFSPETFVALTSTLAGSIQRVRGREGPGCPAPCVEGMLGWEDGNLTQSRFAFPIGISIGLNQTLVVTDADRVRLVTGRYRNTSLGVNNPFQHPLGPGILQDPTTPSSSGGAAPSILRQIISAGRVSTIAGAPSPPRPGLGELIHRQSGDVERSGGSTDGIGQEARFDDPRGVAVTRDGRIYVADASSCRLRRITPEDLNAQPTTCAARLVDVIRPPGCVAYDPPMDSLKHQASPIQGDTRYGVWDETDLIRAREKRGYDGARRGRRVSGICLGAPPPDRGVESNGQTLGPQEGTGWQEFEAKEQTDDLISIHLACPPGCLASAGSVDDVVGGGAPSTLLYAENSPICLAAIHAGVIDDAHGGLVNVSVLRGWGRDVGQDAPSAVWLAEHGVSLSTVRSTPMTGSTRNGVTSVDSETDSSNVPWNVVRTFTVEILNQTLWTVETVAGQPSSPLQDSCGFEDGKPTRAARFFHPSALAVWSNATSLTDEAYATRHGAGVVPQLWPPANPHSPLLGRAPLADDALGQGNSYTTAMPGDGAPPFLLVIADTENHAIRVMSAACTKPCENGGICEGPNTCLCPSGWTGDDCSIADCSSSPCGTREICTGPDTCTCIPGYTGSSCDEPTCVQTCENGGTCSAPDTCRCEIGWFDANCTTPVCEQTCGNGGNCTAPDTCTCPEDWTGSDCRTPVCRQGDCVNGNCTAPDTCVCEPGWSGHTCEKPVCHQGFFRPDPRPNSYAPDDWREPSWRMYVPCDYKDWCNTTNEFECHQQFRVAAPTPVDPIRNITGRAQSPPPHLCLVLELELDVFTPFRYEDEYDNVTEYWRRTPPTPYGWGPTNASHPWSSPSASGADRQIALAQYVSMTQGVFVCANGGNCTAPDTCVCADGWAGFDCRTPICRQGYYYPSLLSSEYPGQGTYRCSERALTVWENPRTASDKFAGYVHDHPNYYSRHMDGAIGWVPVHQSTPALGDDTVEGWRRDGWWDRVAGTDWLHGSCTVEFNRSCPAIIPQITVGGGEYLSYPTDNLVDRSVEKMTRVDTSTIALTEDTATSFTPDISYNSKRVISTGRWYEDEGGECIDQVQRGCFNGGTCVAPDTCLCAEGWEGHDCSLPICSQTVSVVSGTETTFLPSTVIRVDGVNVGTAEGDALDPPSLPEDIHVQFRQCPNNGNCTHPETCTCEKGWTGSDCTTPLCAQECFNGGTCVAPDTCECVQTSSTFYDIRGIPYFRKSDGDPQLTGWTGFDCNTPICVQAMRWVPNSDDGDIVLTSGVDNSGTVFQGACEDATDYTPVNRSRISASMCGLTEWFQGSYETSWENEQRSSFRSTGRSTRINHPNFQLLDDGSWIDGPAVTGEGIYECFNLGACVAPDTCTCQEGWQGYDCNVPTCSFSLSAIIGTDDDDAATDDDTGASAANNATVGCLNGGICAGVNECDCPQRESLLPLVHPDWVEEGAITGYEGENCAIPICTQGWFDDTCTDFAAGCYRCPNGGNCTAPDLCKCPDEWTGFDCSIPVCTKHADADIIHELNTIDPLKVEAFELDPCGSLQTEEWNGLVVGRGNCSSPNSCSCLCKRRSWEDANGNLVEEPWVDPLAGLPSRELEPGYIYGTADCLEGYEGVLLTNEEIAINEEKKQTWATGLDALRATGGTVRSSSVLLDTPYEQSRHFRTCHYTIYVPTWFERNTVLIIIIIIVAIVVLAIAYFIIRRKIGQRREALKRQRRETRRTSEESTRPRGGFINQ